MWEEHVSDDNPMSAVVGALIAADGSVAASVSATAASPGSEYSPSLATGQDHAVVMWQDTRAGNSSRDIYAQRLLPDGTRLDGNGILISSAANNQRSPALAWDGQEFVVSYGDDRNEGTPGIQQFRGDVYASRMDEQGGVLDPDGIEVSREAIMESDPIAGGSGAAALLGCSVFKPGEPYASRQSPGRGPHSAGPRGAQAVRRSDARGHSGTCLGRPRCAWHTGRERDLLDLHGRRGAYDDDEGVAAAVIPAWHGGGPGGAGQPGPRSSSCFRPEANEIPPSAS